MLNALREDHLIAPLDRFPACRVDSKCYGDGQFFSYALEGKVASEMRLEAVF